MKGAAGKYREGQVLCIKGMGREILSHSTSAEHTQTRDLGGNQHKCNEEKMKSGFHDSSWFVDDPRKAALLSLHLCLTPRSTQIQLEKWHRCKFHLILHLTSNKGAMTGQWQGNERAVEK